LYKNAPQNLVKKRDENLRKGQKLNIEKAIQKDLTGLYFFKQVLSHESNQHAFGHQRSNHIHSKGQLLFLFSTLNIPPSNYQEMSLNFSEAGSPSIPQCDLGIS